jgi:hypothetical protein|tara:strand:- start:3290 stop:3724 length:435 start_codon:yes stop_codon:yes gene_type:complete
MAITFTNHLDTNILSPLEALLVAEFTQPVSYDFEYVNRGTNWFNLRPLTDVIEEEQANGHTRSYEILIQYYRMVSGQYKRDTHIDTMSSIMERVKRLIRNNTSHSTFFFNGKLDNINYAPDIADLSSDVLLVEATFTANVFEVV